MGNKKNAYANINCSNSQKELLAKMPKMTTEERAYQYALCRGIINNAREQGKKLKKSLEKTCIR